MIIFCTILIITFHTCSCPDLLAYQTSFFKSFLIYILYSFNIYQSILLFKIAFRNPYSTYIMYPNKMTNRLIGRIGGFGKIIIIWLLFSTLFFMIFWMIILLLMFIIGTLLCKFMILWISIFEKWSIDMYGCSLECTSFDMTERAWDIDPSWSKWCTYLTYPIIRRYLG